MADAALPPPATIDIRERVKARPAGCAASSGSTAWPSASSRFGGIFIIVAVLFIFVFILGEAVPLFRPASGEATGAVTLAAVPPLEYVPGAVARLDAAAAPRAAQAAAAAPAAPVTLSTPGPALVFGTDEYQRYFYEVLSDGRTAFWSNDRRLRQAAAADARWAASRSARPRAASSTISWRSAPRTAASRCSRSASRRATRTRSSSTSTSTCATRASSRSTRRSGRSARSPMPRSTAARRSLAVAGGRRPCSRSVRTTRAASSGWSSRPGTARRSPRVRIGRSDTAVAATDKGNLYHWELVPEPRLTEVVHVSEEPVTALEYVLGNITADRGRRQGQPSRAGSGCARRRTTPTRAS